MKLWYEQETLGEGAKPRWVGPSAASGSIAHHSVSSTPRWQLTRMIRAALGKS